MMRPYLAILDSRCRMLLQYRVVALAGIVTQVFWGLLFTAMYRAFYHASKTAQPLNEGQVITYIWLGQAMLLLTFNRPDSELATMISSGAVAYELTRPVDLYNSWLARCAGTKAAPLVLRAIPILLLGGMFFGMATPVSVSAGVLFLISIILGLILAATITTLVTITMLWTISGEGMAALLPPLIYISSGMLIPLPLWPDWVKRIFDWLPFRGLIDTPFRVYLGDFHGIFAARAMAQQVIWILIIVMIGRVTLQRGLRRLVVQGG